MDAWSENHRRWLPAALFLAVNVVGLLVFLTTFSTDVEAGRSRLSRRAGELDELRAHRTQAEEAVYRVRTSRAGLAEFYGERLAPESESLTRVLAEVKELCRRAGVRPSAIAYGRERLEGQRVLRRSIDFAVIGSYEQLRQLVNLFELSNAFLILEGVTLRGSDSAGQNLDISLQLSTLFTLGAPVQAADAREAGGPEG